MITKLKIDLIFFLNIKYFYTKTPQFIPIFPRNKYGWYADGTDDRLKFTLPVVALCDRQHPENF